jgi:putative transposase
MWAVARYIEQNPTRARIVKKEEDFPYSSARAHIQGIKDEVLGEDLFEEGQRKDYREFIRAAIPEEEKNRIRYSTRTGRPFGSETFVKKMEKKLDRILILKSPGRPRKKEEK